MEDWTDVDGKVSLSSDLLRTWYGRFDYDAKSQLQYWKRQQPKC